MSQEELPEATEGLGVRQRKKLATQRKLLRAARAMVLTGGSPSITEVARKANVSVATAYRYYSDPQRLIADATLDAALDEGKEDFVGNFEEAANGVIDPLQRLLIAQRQIMNQLIEHEAAYRLFIAKGYEEIVRQSPRDNKVVAGGRRILVIEAALKDLRPEMSKDAWLKMLHDLMIVVGPEPFLTLKDFTTLADAAIFIRVDATITAVLAAHWPPKTDL